MFGNWQLAYIKTQFYAWNLGFSVSCTGSGSEEEYDTVEYDDLELEFSIYAALQNYTTWIKERNLDPSPPFQGESRMYSKGLDFEVELIIR